MKRFAMKNAPRFLLFLLLPIAALAGATACSSSDEATMGGGTTSSKDFGGGGGSTGVTQAGAQDFGLFRQIIDDGKIPAPGTLDDLGFFAEHKLDYPTATCGADLCMHGLLGLMGNMITGSDCALVQIGLNSPVDVDKLERPPLHLVLAIDVSGSMQGDSITFVREGLVRMLDHLGVEDRLTLVSYDTNTKLVFEHLGLDDKATMESAFQNLAAGGATNLYGGLFEAYQLAEAHANSAHDDRVILLSDGKATSGLQDPAKMRSLAIAYAKQGIGLTTIGVGKDFDVEVMRQLAEVGAGNFYFLEKPAAVKEVFTEEVKTAFYPLAVDVQIDVATGEGYYLGGAYGTHGFTPTSDGGRIEIPTLFLAKRTDSSAPIDEGRRGGGGAILVELVPMAGLTGDSKLLHVGTVDITWTDPKTGDTHFQSAKLDSPSLPGQVADGGWFSNKTAEKAFVMLNLYTGFRMAVGLYGDGDPGAAQSVLIALRPEVQAWLDDHEKTDGVADPDIADDLTYVDKLLKLLKDQPTSVQTPISQPPNPWPFD